MRRLEKSKLLNMQSRYAYLFIAPAFILMIVFMIFPIFSGLVISFTDWDGIHDKTFVGFGNYSEIFQDKYFYTSLINTIYFVVGSVPPIMLLSLVFAVMLNAGIRGIVFFRGIYFLPTITSGVAIAVIWKWIYNSDSGLLNSILYSLGLPTPDWLNNSKYAMVAIIAMSVWKSLGTNIVIILSGLQSISGTLYEAASIDGANGLKRFWYITVPMLSPTLFFISIITIIGSFQVFEQVLVLTQGGPGDSTLVLVYYIYRQAFENFHIGYASALAYTMFLVILVITIIQWAVRKYWVHSEVE
ncbi:carbohydrate ABC transporter permease [Paenibacillus nasutitermitis]|uniref:Sugar ABC transporter permease n=1 Tax=Paenibacillus nasutitermitis TaxID=1652958 RepID=A0A917DYX4_9BACL|nr:sugar ABC transporter permease [Paenibacillus nasutitermitis]GGD85464.1 sugar ABC transporter permease [Paenibacillus nasutitermitis]